jgi:hypothetical protein
LSTGTLLADSVLRRACEKRHGSGSEQNDGASGT